MDQMWRNAALRRVTPGLNVLDLGCGTGDLTIGAAKRLRGSGCVTGIDFSENMLAAAEARHKKAQYPAATNVRFLHKRAEEIPFEDRPYDLVLSGFVLRNIYENIDGILKGVYASLSKSGRIVFLDFTEPKSFWWRNIWKCYMDVSAGFYGRILFGADFPGTYLTRSAGRFAKPNEFIDKLKNAGYKEIAVRSWLGGVIVMYEAVKDEA